MSLQQFQSSPAGLIEADMRDLMNAVDGLSKADIRLVCDHQSDLYLTLMKLGRLCERLPKPVLEAAE